MNQHVSISEDPGRRDYQRRDASLSGFYRQDAGLYREIE